MRNLLLLALVLTSFVFLGTASANVTSITNSESAFVASTGATPKVTYPAQIVGSHPTYVENGVTISQHDGLGLYVGQWTSILPGNEAAINGPEHVDVALGGLHYAYGLHIVNCVNSGCQTPGMDSAWDVSFYAGSTLVYTTYIHPTPDTDWFFGFKSDQAFDTVQFREHNFTSGALCGTDSLSACNEDDYFGVMLTDGTAPPAPLPELPSIALASVGLVVIGAVAITRRSAP